MIKVILCTERFVSLHSLLHNLRGNVDVSKVLWQGFIFVISVTKNSIFLSIFKFTSWYCICENHSFLFICEMLLISCRTYITWIHQFFIGGMSTIYHHIPKLLILSFLFYLLNDNNNNNIGLQTCRWRLNLMIIYL